MYRFNGYDGRLDREMEAMVMVMEGLEGYEHKIKVRLGFFMTNLTLIWLFCKQQIVVCLGEIENCLTKHFSIKEENTFE